MKLKRHIIIGSWALIMTILALPVRGQETMTKSGTPVRPADKMPILLSSQAKASPSTIDPTAGTYVVVTHPDLLKSLQPLLQWKRQQGYRVELLCTTTNQRDSIRARLTERYEAATALLPAQRYVLLVGDVDRIQAFAERHTPSGLTNRVTDLYYGEYTGDYQPEAYVGRLSVADSAELATVVAKIVAYEQGQWVEAAHQLLFAAGSESRSPAPTTTNGQVNYLSQLAAACLPELDTVCFRNPTSAGQTDSLLQALCQGNALVNYTAHCTTSGWENPYITAASLDTLENNVPTLYVNNCCRSNAFDGTCFGERLLRRPTGGAVGVIGATNETLWNEDYYWAVGAKCPPTLMPEYDSTRKGAFDGMLCYTTDESDYTLGAMMYAGCMAVSMVGSPYDAFYWETYCLLGDPAMTPFLGNGDSIEWALPNSLMAGSSTLTITCTPHTRISATYDTLLLGTTVCGDNGVCHLTLNRALAGDSLTLTASRPGAIPLMATLPIESPMEGRLAVTQYVLDDSVLTVTVRNVGPTTAQRHSLQLKQDSCDRMAGAAFGALETLSLIRLTPQEDTTILFPLGRLAIGNEPLLAALLIASDSLGQPYDTLHIATPTHDLRPKIVGLTVLDSMDRPTTVLLPNTTYRLAATLSHPADSATLEVGEQHITLTETEHCLFPFIAEECTEHIHIALTAYKDYWQHRREGWLLPHSTWERFETGDLSNMPWHTGVFYPWHIDSSTTHEGRCCARSAMIGDAQKTTLELEVETLADDSISFYFMVSSEAHDWLYFYIDGRRVGYWSGNSGWRRYVRLLPAGRHRLQWIYQKDASLSEREDCARIDDLHLPLAIWEQPYGTSERDSSTVAIATIEEEMPFRVYPNPTSGIIFIKVERESQPRYIEVFDICGRMMDKIFIPSNCNSTQYFTTHLRFGVYTLVMHDQKGSHVQKLIVTK